MPKLDIWKTIADKPRKNAAFTTLENHISSVRPFENITNCNLHYFLREHTQNFRSHQNLYWSYVKIRIMRKYKRDVLIRKKSLSIWLKKFVKMHRFLSTLL